jgi:hypothetical protein
MKRHEIFTEMAKRLVPELADGISVQTHADGRISAYYKRTRMGGLYRPGWNAPLTSSRVEEILPLVAFSTRRRLFPTPEELSVPPRVFSMTITPEEEKEAMELFLEIRAHGGSSDRWRRAARTPCLQARVKYLLGMGRYDPEDVLEQFYRYGDSGMPSGDHIWRRDVDVPAEEKEKGPDSGLSPSLGGERS